MLKVLIIPNLHIWTDSRRLTFDSVVGVSLDKTIPMRC